MEPQKFRRGQIWYFDLGRNIDQIPGEQNGVRPCVIVQNDTGNRFSPTTIVVPLTSKNKNKLPTHVRLPLSKSSIALCEQIKTVNKRRVIDEHPCGFLTKEQEEKINTALAVSLGLNKTWRTSDVRIRFKIDDGALRCILRNQDGMELEILLHKADLKQVEEFLTKHKDEIV